MTVALPELTEADPDLLPLAERLGRLPAEDLLHEAIGTLWPGRIVLVSSFGAESAVLLHLAATVDPAIPVVFLNTGRLFGETLRYRDSLIRHLGLTQVREVKPEPGDVLAVDGDRNAWRVSPDLCCHVRKTLPLQRALAACDAWITGRKRFQTAGRAQMPVLERVDGRIKLNPLANWTQDALRRHLDRHALPRHPLEADGFLSIGCMPCTDRVAPHEDTRAGRWRGQPKTECGIHLPRSA